MTDWTNFKVASPYDESPDAPVATQDELNMVIGGALPSPTPQRFNPSLPYAGVVLKFDERDEILLKAVKQAIDNGWVGWKLRVNDATTIGLEGEQLVKEMKKFNTNVKDLLFDQDFCRFLWGQQWETKLQEMVVSRDAMVYLKENI